VRLSVNRMTLLVRGSVKADNSCLFTATARLCQDITAEIQLKTAGRKLRVACADVVLADTDPATRSLMLGHDSVEAYEMWIKNDHHWGGEPEVLMLAGHFGVEIVIVSCESLNFLRYADAAPAKRIYLLYTGQHYDPLLGVDGTLQFSTADGADVVDAREASALELARTHNKEAAERALEKRVNRLKCCGCGAILDDAAAFQEHCQTVEHDDDFTYDCDQVEIVIKVGEEMPEGSLDLNAPDVFAFYNAQAPDTISLSMRCAAVPFELHGKTYATLEELWRAMESETIERRRELLIEAIRVQYSSEAAAASGLKAALLETAPKTIVCVDIDPWLGMQASGGISAGQNGVGRALMATREALLSS